MSISIPIEICREGISIPTYANPFDAGCDVVAAEDVTILPGETKIIPTGIKVAIPHGYEIQVRARSGLSAKTKLRVSNGIGTVDAGFRNEIGIIITNTTESNNIPLPLFHIYDINEVKNNEGGIYNIKKGTRIAQLVLSEVPKIEFKLVDSVADIGLNRGGGFGSSGL
jgi:dUTP pyrophosphatase